MKYQALRKVLGQMSPGVKTGLAAGLGAGGAGLGAGLYDLATPDTFGERLSDTSGEVVESIGDYIEDNPSALLTQLSLLGGSALGSALERRAFRNQIEQEQKPRGYR
jgi:hypothetical protein